MNSPVVWMFIGALVTIVAPVRAQCDPSHAVVAVASVLSTLAVVTIVLIGVYFFLSRRRQSIKLPKNVYQMKKKRDGHNNYGFTDNENEASLEDVTTPRQKGRAHFPDQVPPADNNNDNWPSSPRSARLYRKGSLGSLDETAKFVDPEIVSVTLESQDIIGLGFNICGSYGDGIRVSEVHNRGPAKESGNIQIGDRILSIAVSYQNIVYEDALTILSYASPYPVKIILEKATEISSNNFEDEKQKGNGIQRITHPLFRSRSLNALKHVNHRDNTTHPKRAVSDLKLESVKYFLNWRSKNSKRGNNSYENGTSFAKRVTIQRDKSTEEPKAERESDPRFDNLFYGNKNSDKLKLRSTLHETVAEVTPVSHLYTAEEYNYPISHPEKPERKAKRDSDLQNYSENQVISPTRRPFVYPISSVTDDEIDVDEMFVEPTTEICYGEDKQTPENTSQFAQNNEGIVKHHNLKGQTPRVGDTSVDFTGIDTLFPTLSTDIIVDKSSNNNSTVSATPLNPPILHEEAANKQKVEDTVDTHSSSVELASPGHHDDFVYDFVSTQIDQNSNSKLLTNEKSLIDPPDGEPKAQQHSLPNSSNFTFDDNDHMKPGNPFLTDIAKQIVQTGVTPNSDKCMNSDSYLTIFPTSVSFLNNKTSSHGSNSSRASPENTDESEISDTLEWSGKRLVRSESFSNIFVDD